MTLKKIFNRWFEVVKDEVFEVVVELTDRAARNAAKRVWSPTQQIDRN